MMGNVAWELWGGGDPSTSVFETQSMTSGHALEERHLPLLFFPMHGAGNLFWHGPMLFTVVTGFALPEI